MTAASLWARLQAERLVEGELPPDRTESPWYVRLMLGIAGWIGAIFLLLFVGIGFAFIMESAGTSLVAGAACCAAAFALFHFFDDNDFAQQFALVVSLAGHGLLAVGLAQLLDADQASFFLALAATEALLAILIANFLHRLLATGGAAIAAALAVSQLGLNGLAAPLICAALAFVWLEPKRWAASGGLWRPIGYGLVLALLLVETFRLFGAEWLFGLARRRPDGLMVYRPLIGRAVTALILAFVAVAIALREGGRPGGRVTLAAGASALAFGLLSLGAPGLASAMLVVILGFATGHRLLLALGILALFGFVAHFYYSLHATLLEKSGLLAVTGLCLIAAHFALPRLFPAGPESRHA